MGKRLFLSMTVTGDILLFCFSDLRHSSSKSLETFIIFTNKVILNRRFGTTCLIFKGQDVQKAILTFQNGTDM
jgi:hypothetical protein